MDFKILNSVINKAATHYGVKLADYFSAETGYTSCDCFDCQDSLATDIIDKMSKDKTGKLPDNYTPFYGRVVAILNAAQSAQSSVQSSPVSSPPKSYSGGSTTPKAPKPEPTANSIEGFKPQPLWSWNYTPRTQKARGITFLLANASFADGYLTNNHNFFPAGLKLDEFMNLNFPLFARPCPKTPRHGFVDSRLVNNKEELAKVMQETLEADPESEIGVCKMIKSPYSAVYANGTLAVGSGHDGATSGKSSRTFLTIGSENPVLRVEIPKEIVPEGETVYYEFVYDNDNECYVVQARSGPVVKTGLKNLIFNEGPIVELLAPTGDEDLLVWEKTIQAAAGKPGVCVYTKDLGNHFAVHCIVNKVNVITSHMPTIGEVLVKSEEMAPLDPDAFRVGFEKGAEIGSHFDVTNSNVHASLGAWLAYTLHILHNAAQYIAAGEAERIGIAAGVFVNIVAVLGAGEMRHKAKNATIKFGGSRNDVYTAASTFNDASKIRSLLISNYAGFSAGGWSGGFGGPKWADVTKGGIDVFNAMFESPEKVIAELNIAVNKEHNGGWFMNKFAQHDLMDAAVANPSKFTILHGAELFRTLVSVIDLVETAKLDSAISKSDLDDAIKAVKAETQAEIHVAPIPAKPVVISFKNMVGQVRVNGDKLRFQIKPDAAHSATEVDIEFTSADKDFVEKLKNTEHTKKSTAGSNVMYAPINIDGDGIITIGDAGDIMFSKGVKEVIGYNFGAVTYE